MVEINFYSGSRLNFYSGSRVNLISEEQTASPSILNVSYSYVLKLGYNFNWQVKNLDAVEVSIYSNALDDTPETYRGTAVYNATVDCSENTGETGPFMAIYAKAQASGKTVSNIVSFYYEP